MFGVRIIPQIGGSSGASCGTQQKEVELPQDDIFLMRSNHSPFLACVATELFFCACSFFVGIVGATERRSAVVCLACPPPWVFL